MDPVRKLRHDIRGHFQSLSLIAEVLRGEVPPDEREMFLGHIVEACEQIEELIGQIPESDEPDPR